MKAFICALTVFASVSAASILAGPARAEMTEVFNNTVMSHYPDGGWVKHWFNRDGSYSAQFSDGRRITATWRVEGERVCLNGIRPAFLMINRFCSPMIEASLGQTWQSRDPLGRRVRNVLVAGR
jgi:hypothetical protein